jgi:hypothetical protein
VLTTVLMVVLTVAGVAAVLALVVIPALPDRARADEEAARAFFDRHGHWPDEPPPGG